VKDFCAATATGILFSLNMALFTEAGEVHAIEALAASSRMLGWTTSRSSRCAAIRPRSSGEGPCPAASV
jgi:hypothetical protein